MATLALQQAAADALEQSFALPTYRIDTKTSAPDKFVNLTTTDWSQVTWKDIGRPFEVTNYSSERRQWEEEHHEAMPVQTQWEFFNRHFHDLFITDNLEARAKARQELFKAMGRLNFAEAVEAFTDLIQLAIWNRIHRVEDAVWDPRGKRALFEGMDVKKPNILFLGAADGYEAMQLLAMYPGGHAVLVDYDDFCRTDRFGKFPESYPFLGQDPSTGHYKTYHRADMDIDFDVADIRDLKYGKEFDIVISVGLIEHFPDEHKPHAIEFHRRFLKPGGYAIVTTPRLQFQSKLYYRIMGELVNFGYRELMTAHQMGLYLYENGFNILRCGVIKAHNGIIAQPR
ncbi:MAG: class I SAM-dependent methyltransferase [Anaerolineae bacterium]|nr:class I SAM-dependent methyltransferase [Anaerolineae bacterium]